MAPHAGKLTPSRLADVASLRTAAARLEQKSRRWRYAERRPASAEFFVLRSWAGRSGGFRLMRSRPAGALATRRGPAGPANSLRSDSSPGHPRPAPHRCGAPEIGGTRQTTPPASASATIAPPGKCCLSHAASGRERPSPAGGTAGSYFRLRLEAEVGFPEADDRNRLKADTSV